MDVNIIRKITSNGAQGGVNYPTWIVIHETDNEDKGANALCHARALANGNLSCSAHYYVDESNIVQVHEHWTVASHVGVKYGTPPIGGIGNKNSIGIEICVNEDSNYSKARQNAIELTKYLISTIKIPASRVVKHYDACKKYCPRKMLDSPSLWNDFKSQISNASVNSSSGLLKIGSKEDKVKQLQANLNKLGYTCGNADGIFGQETKNAVISFQRNNELSADGIVGQSTWNKILSNLEDRRFKPLPLKMIYDSPAIQIRDGFVNISKYFYKDQFITAIDEKLEFYLLDINGVKAWIPKKATSPR
ncbi:N-acetylmuramoyl-L-alanine amidase (plasmid) [Clostridium botulinum]|uniref:peptidoglycan recognition protein family protein n=1 Tax=Clostridium botulinum TaxID=1491 RepID=UPI00069C749F|nr:N-acetylmuramoyl-L-alanine amidase [Clostridium botulinum]KOA94861.1 N-acetylmuramoyl-L-alanine amidase [Clostridium botulinum]